MTKSIFAKAAFSVVWILAAFTGHSQDNLEKSIVNDLKNTTDFAMGVENEQQIRGAVMVYRQMKDSGVDPQNFEITIWGKVVEEMAENEELASFIEESQDGVLRFTVCSFAMQRFEVTAKDLPKGEVPVPNAWTRLLQLQAKGYNTLVL